jgi:phosphoribosyl 1,2-cyclic phosphodiesterase
LLKIIISWYNLFEMKIITLASGSKGNCTLVKARGKNILIDCGSSYTRLSQALNQKGLSFGEIDCIFITHSHDDHISALPMVLKNNPFIEMYAHVEAINEIARAIGRVPQGFDADFDFHGIEISAYKCHHDARCIGYKLNDGEETACFVTDTGCVDKKLISFLKGASKILIESNHDYDMLVRGGYPPALKKRIAGMNGHLSNEQAAYLLERADLVDTKEIILAHLSENNNTPQLAFQSAFDILRKMGVEKRITLKIAKQWEVCE